MEILVTSGAGFIGSYLCRRLIEQGNNVICVDVIAINNALRYDKKNISDQYCCILHCGLAR